MIEIGKYNTLKINRRALQGFYLIDEESKEEILLPNNSISDGLKEGDEVKVFAYMDSKDRPIATTNEPLCSVGSIARLKVVADSKIGAFVSIGLSKDVLVPFKEQAFKLKVGESYLFYLYLDKSGRISATTYIDKLLETTNNHKSGDEVFGTVYGFQTNGSIMVAVNNKYRGVILKKEYYRDVRNGEVLQLYVKKHYEDGKMELTMRKTGEDEREKLEKAILNFMKTNGGFMPYNDDSSPEEVKEVFHESKNFFKKALGGLIKKGLIYEDEKGTHLK